MQCNNRIFFLFSMLAWYKRRHTAPAKTKNGHELEITNRDMIEAEKHMNLLRMYEKSQPCVA